MLSVVVPDDRSLAMSVVCFSAKWRAHALVDGCFGVTIPRAMAADWLAYLHRLHHVGTITGLPNHSGKHTHTIQALTLIKPKKMNWRRWEKNDLD